MADKKKKGKEEVWGYEDAGKSGAQAFREFLYNPEKGTVLGRTALSWGKIGLFYMIYYCCLAAFWAAMLFAFFATTSPDYPSWISGNGIIGNNPGLGFRPHPPNIHEDDSLVWLKDSVEDRQNWIELADEFLHPYERFDSEPEKWGDFIMKCDDNTTYESPDQKACGFPLKQLGEHCTKENGYGYNSSSPCVFLKLNKIYDWYPSLYEEEKDLTAGMPKALISVIKDSGYDRRVWVWCDGQNPADKENIGPITYYPAAGFHAMYYPYKKVEGYRQPLVAMKFGKPKVNTLINVECKVWWPEAVHESMNRMGMVRFQLLVDPFQ